jgi:hypothetical protein
MERGKEGGFLPHKMLHNSYRLRRRIATALLVIPGQTLARRRQPPSPRTQSDAHG